MSRALDATFLSAITSTLVRPVYLMLWTMNTVTLKLCNRRIDVAYSSNTYEGNGWLQGVSGLGDNIDGEPTQVDVQLTGIASSLISALLYNISGPNTCYIYFGAVDADGVLIGTPYLAFSGVADEVEVTESAKASEARITFVDKVSILTRSSGRRYTAAAQKALYPEDTGFDYVQTLGSWDGRWGDSPRNKTKKQRSRIAKVKRNRIVVRGL